MEVSDNSGRGAVADVLTEAVVDAGDEVARGRLYVPPPIAGYQNLNQSQVDEINMFKRMEKELTRKLDFLEERVKERGNKNALRWIALTRTHVETGFMFAVKAVANFNGN